MKFITLLLVFGLTSLMAAAPASKNEKTGKKTETTKTAAKPTDEKTETKKAEPVDNPFQEYQDEIKNCQAKLKAAKTNSQKRNALKTLQQAQRKLKFQYDKKTKPLKVSLAEKNISLKNSRNANKKASLQMEIKKMQAELQSIEKLADMKKWCEVPADELEKNKDVTAGKRKKNKKTRKNKNK